MMHILDSVDACELTSFPFRRLFSSFIPVCLHSVKEEASNETSVMTWQPQHILAPEQKYHPSNVAVSIILRH